MEEIWVLDVMQSAYRKNQNITQCLLYFILSTTEVFKRGHVTIATFIDFEGAFDAVWRSGAVPKLQKAGLSGNMILYLNSFLQDRTSRSIVNEFIADWVETHTGVPQGSVVAPLIFILFTSHDTSAVHSCQVLRRSDSVDNRCEHPCHRDDARPIRQPLQNDEEVATQHQHHQD